jgi:hypothetical protein
MKTIDYGIENFYLFSLVHTKKKKKQVKFLLGKDGNEWCWVMGEPETSSKIINNNKLVNLDYLFNFTVSYLELTIRIIKIN